MLPNEEISPTEAPSVEPIAYCNVPYIEPDPIGRIVGIDKYSGLLIHEHEDKRWISGYTLAGYGVDNLTAEERKACNLT
jgi:hypothetical protein